MKTHISTSLLCKRCYDFILNNRTTRYHRDVSEIKANVTPNIGSQIYSIIIEVLISFLNDQKSRILRKKIQFDIHYSFCIRSVLLFSRQLKWQFT